MTIRLSFPQAKLLTQLSENPKGLSLTYLSSKNASGSAKVLALMRYAEWQNDRLLITDTGKAFLGKPT